MAKMDVKMPEEFLKNLARLGARTDDITKKCLTAGGAVALMAVKSGLDSVLSGTSTGELSRSLGLSKPLQDGKGDWNVKVGFREPRRDGGVNAKIANILEYGSARQPQRPFLKRAKSQSKAACVAAMKETFTREAGAP